MKAIIAICIVSLIALGCHRKQLVRNHISCCPQDEHAAAAKTAAADSGQSSIYQLPGVWTDQHNHTLPLRELKGKVQVMAMIFTHCGYACPRIVQDMKAIEDSLPGTEKKKVGFVLVSFDAQRDDPAQLRRFAAEQGLDDRWTLLHGSSRQVRALSMLLGVKYQEAGDGNFSHSNAILILDAGGTIAGNLEGLRPGTNVAADVINHLVTQ